MTLEHITPPKRGGRAPLTPEQRADLAKRYPHESNDALAERYGCEVHSIKNLAAVNGWKKSKERRTEAAQRGKPGELRAAIRQYASTRPDGFTQVEVRKAVGMTAMRVSKCLWVMTNAGELHAARSDGAQKRWFSCPTAAREFELAKAQAVLAQPDAAPAPAAASSYGRRQGLPMSQVRPAEQYARQTAAARRELPAVVPEGVKVTRARTINYDPRYSVAPDAVVPRLFSVVPPGVDPMTGRAWGMSA
jgi:hypothetical protein